jgi:photosystem II stability/assembly factor-like uncharacterized protein
MPNMERWRFPGPPHIAHTKTLAVDPRDPSIMYAGVEQGALLATTDGGRSWSEIDSYDTPEDRWYRDIHQVVLHPERPDEIFMTTGIGLYHSPDRGQTWRHLTDPDFRIGYPDQLVFSPEDDRVLFMSGAWRDPTTWRESRHARSTILRSDDGGVSWQAPGAGLPSDMRANVEALTVASHAGGFTLFAGTTDGEIWASDDGARTWRLLASGLPPVSKVGHYRNLQPTSA